MVEEGNRLDHVVQLMNLTRKQLSDVEARVEALTNKAASKRLSELKARMDKMSKEGESKRLSDLEARVEKLSKDVRSKRQGDELEREHTRHKPSLNVQLPGFSSSQLSTPEDSKRSAMQQEGVIALENKRVQHSLEEAKALQALPAPRRYASTDLNRGTGSPKRSPGAQADNKTAQAQALLTQTTPPAQLAPSPTCVLCSTKRTLVTSLCSKHSACTFHLRQYALLARAITLFQATGRRNREGEVKELRRLEHYQVEVASFPSCPLCVFKHLCADQGWPGNAKTTLRQLSRAALGARDLV